jgi:hypothetical protein
MQVVELDEETMEILENIIDCYGVSGVLSGISFICGEKALHLTVECQNTVLGKHWMRLSANVDQAAAKIEKNDPYSPNLRLVH